MRRFCLIARIVKNGISGTTGVMASLGTLDRMGGSGTLTSIVKRSYCEEIARCLIARK